MGRIHPLRHQPFGVELDFATLDTLRQSHPAWRLLRADLSPLVLSFLSKTYIVPNVRA